MIAKHIVTIAGFTQHMGRPTGVGQLWYKLREHASPRCEVGLRSWDDNFGELAEFIWRYRPKNQGGQFNGHGPEVVAIGYSFGGYSAVVLARQLAERGIEVKELVLCDPVYRHWYKAGWWRSVVPGSTITVPWNVKRVRWLRQMNPRFRYGGSGSRLNPWNYVHPAGHDLRAEAPKLTLIEPPVVLKRDHRYMDDAAEFHEMALEAAA